MPPRIGVSQSHGRLGVALDRRPIARVRAVIRPFDQLVECHLHSVGLTEAMQFSFRQRHFDLAQEEQHPTRCRQNQRQHY